MRYLSADYVFPISSKPIKDGVVVIDKTGEVRSVSTRAELGTVDLEIHKGILLPGFVNAHCHLELSHMKGLCPTGTKLIPFIRTVVQLREFEQDQILEALAQEDENMWASGIQAVGDISNKVDTFAQKETSPIAYYTFVEMFDMMQQSLTLSTIENYRAVFTGQSRSNGNKKSFVPHAPYSVTPELFDFINRANPASATISIHNTETEDENLMFKDGSGNFKDFFNGFGMNLDNFEPIGKGSIHYALAQMQPKKKNLFVHNTLTTAADISEAHSWSDQVYWVTCPNANLYIENRLPDYKLFLESEAKMCIGTDSIMSNWQLDIWEEIKTIKKLQSYVPLEELFTWATINGATALGYQNKIGSIEVGKQPGIVLVNLDWKGDDTQLGGSMGRRLV